MDTEYSDLSELSGKLICNVCVGESYLSPLIIREGKAGICSYCREQEAICITIFDLANCVEKTISEHYSRTSDEPDDYQYAMLRDRESDYDWERDGEPIHDLLCELLIVEEEVSSDIVEVLADRFDCRGPGDPDEDESEFSPTSYYELNSLSLGFWNQKWERLENALKNESRFFNQEVLEVLRSVFADLHDVRSRSHGLAVVAVGPETFLPALFRAREFQSEEGLQAALSDPVRQLGPPPGSFARAGRMNASGISVFYGAEQPQAALSEVRPVVGSNVVVAKFSIVRPLSLLDLRALETVVFTRSVFDPTSADERVRMGFLRTLTKRLTVPVMPGAQDREYLTTQAVADYLSGFTEPQLDGILFPSVQNGSGVNVVLFHKASSVEPLDKPEGTELCASIKDYDYETGSEYDWYQISLRASPEGNYEGAASASSSDLHSFLIPQHEATERKPALRLEMNSIEVHKVDAVKVETTPHSVYVSFGKPNSWLGKESMTSDDF